ncbi:MAG: PAS domain-containing sensor histidine kinase [Desulfobacterales bacterium]|jgi:PAS domain S-box-containing protein
MSGKETYEELKKKVRKLEKKTVTYKDAKKNLKASFKKQDSIGDKHSEPEMAVEVLDQEFADKQPVEQALIAEHIFRRTIEESIPSGISGIDLAGRQIYVNRVFCEMTGWREDELLETEYPFIYWPAEVVESFKDEFQLLLSDSIPSEGIELPFQRKNGEQFYGLVTSSELKDRGGNTMGRLMSVADISAQKRAEIALRDLSSRLVNAQESERKLVSQELHDGIGGKLTAIKYSLEKILSEINQSSNVLADSLNDVLSILHDTIDETQRIYRNLHPSILDDLGLKAAIRSVCREFNEIYSHIRVENEINIKEELLSDSLKILIYRILQETMNNISKHSHADHVNVSLRQSEKEIALIVEDNGVGFDLDEIHEKEIFEKGFGLKNIKERTELFGGTLTVISASNKGTVIRASWPIE